MWLGEYDPSNTDIQEGITYGDHMSAEFLPADRRGDIYLECGWPQGYKYITG